MCVINSNCMYLLVSGNSINFFFTFLAKEVNKSVAFLLRTFSSRSSSWPSYFRNWKIGCGKSNGKILLGALPTQLLLHFGSNRYRQGLSWSIIICNRCIIKDLFFHLQEVQVSTYQESQSTLVSKFLQSIHQMTSVPVLTVTAWQVSKMPSLAPKSWSLMKRAWSQPPDTSRLICDAEKSTQRWPTYLSVGWALSSWVIT